MSGPDYFNETQKDLEKQIDILKDEMNQYIICMFCHINEYDIVRHCSSQINQLTQKIDREYDNIKSLDVYRTTDLVKYIIENDKKRKEKKI